MSEKRTLGRLKGLTLERNEVRDGLSFLDEKIDDDGDLASPKEYLRLKGLRV